MNTDRTPTRFPPLPDVPPEAWEDRMNDWPDRTPTEPYCEECRHHPGRSLHATHARTPTTAAGRRLVADATDHPIWASAMLGYVLAIEAEARAPLEAERDLWKRDWGIKNDQWEKAIEARASLDVDGLAHALHMLHVPGWFNGHRSSDLDLAAAIAREYAALREETTDG